MSQASEQEPVALHQRTQTICLLVLAAVAIGGALFFLRPVLVPFVLALFISMVVTPVMDFLNLRLRMPRGLSIVATILIGVSGLVLLGALVSSSLGELSAQQKEYQDKFVALADSAKSRLLDFFPDDDGALPTESATPTQLGAAPTGAPAAEQALAGSDEPTSIRARLDSSLDSIMGKAPTMIGTAMGWAIESGLSILSRGFLVMIFMMFLITGHRGPKHEVPGSLSSELRKRVKEYLRVKVIVSAITGVAVYLILSVIGIDLALVFGLSAFFLNFIPNIGSAIAVLLPVPVILMSGPQYNADGALTAEGVSATGRVLAIALPALVQFLVGSVLEPKWMGASLDLNPIVILLSLIFWGMLWGPVGMLLSVPITAVLKILLERLSYTRPIALLLADSPPAAAGAAAGGE